MNAWNLSFQDRFSLGMTIKGAWVYEKMPNTDILKEGLSRLSITYPYLRGRYDGKANAVKWDENAIGTIPLEEVDARRYKVMDVVGHPRLAWSLVRPYDIKGFKKGMMPPLTASLVHLDDGEVLYVQAAHALMDADSFYGFVGQWADLCKGMPITPMVLDQSLRPRMDAWSKEQTLEKVKQQGWIKIGAWSLLKMIWSLARYNLSKKTVSVDVPLEEVEELRNKSGAGTHGVLSALAARTLYARLKGHGTFRYITVVDMRGRFPGIGQDFMGNFSQAFLIGGDYDLKKSTECLAAEISSDTRRFVSSDALGEAFQLCVCASGYGLPYFCFDPSENSSSNPGMVYINNQLKFRACEMDWGFGWPKYVFPNELSDMVKLWQPVAKGPYQIIYGGPVAKVMGK